MNVFAVIVLVIGVSLVVGFLVYEVLSLVRDIKKHVAKKKAQKEANKDVVDDKQNK